VHLIPKRTRHNLTLLIFGLIGFAACAHYPVNDPLAHYDPNGGYRFGAPSNEKQPAAAESIFLGLAFSGGGMRAAAFSYGALEELARTNVAVDGRHVRLLDEVDVISSISGGSFTAAYYALNHDRIFDDFETRFLRQNIQRKLLWQFCYPWNWVRLASPYFSRSDLVADYYNRHIFDGKTFGDLIRGRGRPFLTMTATDMSSGGRFIFTQEEFDMLGSDLSSTPIARAVAASSAFPVLLSPITVNNYAKTSQVPEPSWVKDAYAEPSASPASDRRLVRAKEFRVYENSTDHPYIHLIDGGVSDNLGTRAFIDTVISKGGARNTWQDYKLEKLRKVVVIVVNAAAENDPGWDRKASPPNVVQVVLALGSVSINRYSFETSELFHESMKRWETELNQAAAAAGKAERIKFYPIEISFEAIQNGAERDYFDSLPTTFNLPPGAVDRLRAVAGRLLRESKDYQALLHDLESEESPPTDK